MFHYVMSYNIKFTFSCLVCRHCK